MLKWLFVLAMFLAGGCASSPENLVKVTITNTTPHPLVIRAGTSIFGVSTIIMPGQTWSGVVDRRWVGSTASVTIAPFSPESR